MPIVDAILMEMEQEAKTTRRVLERIPDDKLGWKPHAKSFTLGQLAMHIAGGQKQIAKMANEDVWEVGNFTVPEAKSRKELLETLDEGTSSAKHSLQKMDDAKLMSTWTLDEERQDDHGGAEDRPYSLRDDESFLPSSRAALRIFADAGCAGAIDLRAQRG